MIDAVLLLEGPGNAITVGGAYSNAQLESPVLEFIYCAAADTPRAGAPAPHMMRVMGDGGPETLGLYPDVPEAFFQLALSRGVPLRCFATTQAMFKEMN
ncbi:hypothetical protein [Deinococcus kurensis]|uniref:hypothetical protein n=1 Tax=Deinococcus kurensis TaxID=2662757 RepID=UPI0012D36C82|nr:hypothetical protein [Deinococcus kurensis]